jgi:hypothetical protein
MAIGRLQANEAPADSKGRWCRCHLPRALIAQPKRVRTKLMPDFRTRQKNMTRNQSIAGRSAI